jgi:hypothetical protein
MPVPRPGHARGPRRLSGRLAAPTLAVTALLATLVGVSSPASAHTTDPRLVSVIDTVEPRLPQGVTVEVVPNVANQLVVANATASPLIITGASGDSLVRIARDGVDANLASPEWYVVNDPVGSATPPDGLRVGSHPQWTRVSSGSSFGWFDTRLYPRGAVPADVTDGTDAIAVASWSVPMRYAGRRLNVAGHVEFRPLLGGYVVDVADLPAGLLVEPLQGRLPGLFVDTRGHTLTVSGSDGMAFLRFGGGSVTVNTASASYLADRQARRLPVGAPHGWAPRASGTSTSWLDPRLAVPSKPPTDAAHDSVTGHWAIPVRIDGRAATLRGDIRWQPGPRTTAPPVSGQSEDRRADLWVTVAAGVAAVALTTLWSLRRRRPRSRSSYGRPRGRGPGHVEPDEHAVARR